MTPATTEANDVAMTHDLDWEGPWCRYAKYIQDKGVIKAWYMGHHTYDFNKEKKICGGRLCYAVSQDGWTFTKPNLGLYDWKGSKYNNVLFDDATFKAADGKDWINSTRSSTQIRRRRRMRDTKGSAVKDIMPARLGSMPTSLLTASTGESPATDRLSATSIRWTLATKVFGTRNEKGTPSTFVIFATTKANQESKRQAGGAISW